MERNKFVTIFSLTTYIYVSYPLNSNFYEGTNWVEFIH